MEEEKSYDVYQLHRKRNDNNSDQKVLAKENANFKEHTFGKSR